MKNLWMTSMGELANFLEKEIAEGRNPTTEAEWDALLERMAAQGQAEHVGEVPNSMDASLLAANLREEGIKAKALKLDEDKSNG